MKRGIAFVLLAVILFTLASVSLAGQVEPYVLPCDAKLRTNAQLRSGPSTQTESKMVLMKGTTVTLMDLTGLWFYVQYGNFTGYIRSDLIESNIPSGTQTIETTLPPVLSAGTDRNLLKMGMRGEDVLAVQQMLLRLRYDVGTPDGVFGKRTKQAIIEFQTDYGLTRDGIVGKKTFDTLYAAAQESGTPTAPPTAAPTQQPDGQTVPASSASSGLTALRYGDRGSGVMALQQVLKYSGLYQGGVDGVFGPGTQAGVKLFQKLNGLAETGVADTVTLALLHGTSAGGGTGTGGAAGTGTGADTSGLASLQYGDEGPAVKTLQQALRKGNYYQEGVDGDFGAATQAGVKLFQKTNGLPETGVADVNTLALLYSGRGAVAPEPTPFVPQYPGAGVLPNPPSASQVVLANWETDIKPFYKSGQTATIYDFQARLGWQIRFYAMGEHADSDPLTAMDTEVMFRAFGLKNTWTPRPVWVVMPDGRVFMGSVHNMPHLSSGVKDNNFDGHMCLHFPRRMEDAERTGTYAVTHQKCIQNGWLITQGMR